MEIYRVGGCVRDQLLGVPVNDEDFVVVGATAAQMLADGFLQVGADFPVFLHPKTGQEYALARTERKSGHGYQGFLVGTENVTLEEDLARRDLTINAMAQDAHGAVIDPYGGRDDLKAKVLRHVGPAFVEDPVRVLRLLRFRARLGTDWAIAPETEELMHRMVREGELSHLTAERVWKELSRALMEPHAQLFLDGLNSFGLLGLEPFRSFSGATKADMDALAQAVRRGLSLESRFCLAFVTGGEVPPMGAEVPRSVQSVARSFVLLAERAGDGELWGKPAAVLNLLHVAGALRNDPTDFEQALDALRCRSDRVRRWGNILRSAQDCVLCVDTKAITAAMPPGPAVGKAIAAARESALGQLLEGASF